MTQIEWRAAPETREFVKVPLEDFKRKWICGVVRSGYHNGSRCTPTDPHSGWGCSWYLEVTYTAHSFAELERDRWA